MIGGIAAAAGVAEFVVRGRVRRQGAAPSEGDGSAAAKEVMDKFHGEVKLDVRDSKEDWSQWELKHAPEGAPNVLVVLYDDTGMATGRPTASGQHADAAETCRQRPDLPAVAHHCAVLPHPVLAC